MFFSLSNIAPLNTGLFFLILPLFFRPGLSCPNEKYAAKCCNDFFTIYRHLRWPSCQTFEYLETCFSYTSCDLTQLSLICSNEYKKVHGKHIPKEAVLAVYRNLRGECTKYCTRYGKLETDCSIAYSKQSATRKNQDKALKEQIEFLKNQLRPLSDRILVSDLCKSLFTTLRRLHGQRSGVCEATVDYCLCRRLQDELPQMCPFRCSRFRRYGWENAEGFVFGGTVQFSTVRHGLVFCSILLPFLFKYICSLWWW